MQPLHPRAPGTLTLIGGIKTALIDDHHEAFYWWWKSKLKDATLFHVDGHDDLAEAYVERKLESERDYALLNIANFICPAAHHDIVSSIYWLNPHAQEKCLQDFGKLMTSFSGGHEMYSDQSFKYAWRKKDRQKIERSEGKIVKNERVKVPSDLPLVLDIDLDAFCCHKTDTLSFLPVKSNDYEGALGFEERIDQAMEVLAKLPKPNLITIASSQGNLGDTCYVTPFMVDDVSRYLAINLRKIYE